MTIATESPALIESEHTAVLHDGVRMFYRAWQPPEATRAVILFHRGHEHSGRLAELARSLDLDNTAIFAWDQRGHGKSPGARGYAESFGTLVKDADSFVKWICEHHGIALENMAIVAHSVGAVIAAAWVHDYAPPLRAMVLVTPAFRVRLYVPLAIPGLRAFNRFKRPAFIKSYVRSGMITHDPEQAAAYDADPLISRNIAVNILLGLYDAGTRLLADAGAIRTPTLMLSAGSDCVVSTGAQRRFFERLGSSDKRMTTFNSFSHAVLHEKGREKAFAAIREFLSERLNGTGVARTPSVASPAATVSARDRLSFAVSKLVLRTVGRLSNGIRLGWRTGFDSGQSLDHVYENRSRGWSPLGRLIDRIYLDTPGWRGIRNRKRNLTNMLETAIRDTHADGKPVHILDVAAGPGRYVLEALERTREIPSRAVLRDRDSGGLAAGQALAAAMKRTDVSYEPGDAFDPSSLATVQPRPTIAIVSGVYELFSDNELILRSLRGLHAILPENGTLIYTNQPWHPQLAFIAAVLTNRDGKPWVMRCRTQAEMDDLVSRTGFEKVDQLTDDDAIFTVSRARRA